MSLVASGERLSGGRGGDGRRGLTVWKRARYRIEYFGVRLLEVLVPRLPRRVAHLLADLCGSVYYLADARARRVALANLEAAFGDGMSVGRRRWVARRSVCNLARTFFDLFWVPNLDGGNYRRYIDARNAERFVDVPRAAGCGAVFFCHHFGNWEWLIQVSGFVGGDTLFVAQEFKNSLLDDVFRRLREHAGCRQTGRRGALLRLAKALRAGTSTGLLVDLTVPPGQSSVVIDAFGMKMCVSGAAAALHRRFGAPLVPNISIPRADGRLETRHLEPLDIPAGSCDRAVTQACWDVLEPVIREHPEYWIWVYKHWRYRPRSAPAGRYPFYANVSGRFEELLGDSSGEAG